MNDIYSFYKLISEFKIEIPVIQRDYAQGRSDTKAMDVRKSIVEKILESVTKDAPLFFDFVYGRIEGDTFIPFDGQQRLTTLFLFHRYVFEKCKCNSDCVYRENCQCMSLLSRFTYATRQSSREFCEQLINNTIIPQYCLECSATADCINQSMISEYVKDSNWFYPDWSKDPTIIGMLAMLDEIDKQCKQIEKLDFKIIAQKLTSGCVCPITFHFVDMGEHKMSDSTYIKMNARGKSLTCFENFKASLEEYLDKKGENDLKERFVDNIDGKWLDLFYNETKPYVPDLTMLSFFKRHFLNHYIANEGKDQNVIDKLENQITADDFIPFSIFENVLDGNVKDVLTPLFNLMDTLVNNYNYVMQNSLPVWWRDDYKAAQTDEEKKTLRNTIWNLFEGNWNKKGQKSEDNETAGSERYQSRVLFYAVVKYFEKIQAFNAEQFAQWMRIIWNYTENIQYNNFEDYNKDLSLVDRISSYLWRSYDFNSLLSVCGKINSRQSRLDEELTKVKLISNNPVKWTNRINDLEKHKYFSGEIKFMFDFLSDNPGENHFDSYSEIMRELFSEGGLNPKYDKDGEYRFRRTLMYFSTSHSFGFNTTKKNSNNWSFLKNKDRDISWKRFISDSKVISTGTPHNQVLKSLINVIHNQRSKGKSFNEIFDFYLSYSANVWDWRYYFIESHDVWSYMSDNKFVRRDNDNEIYLMKTTQMNGTHAELRTYYLYSKINAIYGWRKNYYEVAGRENQPCLFFEKKSCNDTVVIDILWDIHHGKGYYLKLFTRSAVNTNVNPVVSANTPWGLFLSDSSNPNSRYMSRNMNEKDIVDLATKIMSAI